MSKSVRTRFNVEVTEADIERAHKNDSYNCVVAQAVARTVPDATRIEVDSQTIRFTTQNERRVYMTPYAVQGYVIAFDAGDHIEPFSFQLRDPKRIKRVLNTEAGKAVRRATERARRGAKKSATAIAKTENDVITGMEDPKQAATAAYAEAKRDHAKGETLRKVDGGDRKAPPRVFKKKQRSYGHRLLRINQQGDD